ncbi:MAG: hypothetical protein A2156_07395 [Deltaproteobacteria bacterium RBG_16_48_10]|nr:MAG: hypothetical protein A2156_07395 [Deltaproteobacteria bacterium RBG_16_48_10]
MKIDRLARKGILDLAPYIPGKSIEEVERELGKKRWVKLASNENVLGPSPKAHAEKSIRMVREGRRYLYQELDKMGLFYVPSQANFIFMDLVKDSKEILQNLLKEGVIIRPEYIWGYPTFARVTVGRMEDNKRFINALRKVLK